MFKQLKSLARRVGFSYVNVVNKREYYAQRFAGINERPIEYGFVFRHLTRLWPRTVLDVGTGITALPELMRTCGFLVTAMDNKGDYWPSAMTNRHYFVIDDDITKTMIHETFDFITCISVLEHIQEHDSALRSLSRLLNPGGHLVITFPYNEKTYAPNVYEVEGSASRGRFSFVTQAFSRKEVETWVSANPLTIVEQEYWRFFTGKYWTVGERVLPPVPVSRDQEHQLSCLLLTKSEFLPAQT
jgi:SAM-dependent methyltransferase